MRRLSSLRACLSRPSPADPAPFLHQELLVCRSVFEIDGGDDFVAGQHRSAK